MVTVNITAPASGSACASFNVLHGLGAAPASIPEIEMTSLGRIAFISPFYDATKFYLQASAPGLTAIAKVS